MLTSFQCDVVAYTKDGEFLCPSCAEADAVENGLVDEDGEVQRQNADGLFIHLYGILDPELYGPVIRYGAEEGSPGGLECGRCDAVIVEGDPDYCLEHDEWKGFDETRCAYAVTYGLLAAESCRFPDVEVDPNPPLPRWVPCSRCGARDGERHREGCSYLS